METIFITALCAAGISFTVTWTSIFEPVRGVIGKLHPKLEELINCPWCFCHYVVFAILLLTKLEYVQAFKYQWANFFFTSFAVICVCGVLHWVLLRAYEPVMQKKIDEQMSKARKAKAQ